jgi:hypothetical protein
VRDVRFWWKRYDGHATMVRLDCDSVDWLADAFFFLRLVQRAHGKHSYGFWLLVQCGQARLGLRSVVTLLCEEFYCVTESDRLFFLLPSE